MIAYVFNIIDNIIISKISNCIDFYKNNRGNYELVDNSNNHYIIDGGVNFKILVDTSTLKIGDIMDNSLVDLRDQLKLTDVQKLQNTVTNQTNEIKTLTNENTNLQSQVSEFGNDLLNLMGV